MAKKQKNKGVTLIELLIVVLILAALAAIAVPKIAQSALASIIIWKALNILRKILDMKMS